MSKRLRKYAKRQMARGLPINYGSRLTLTIETSSAWPRPCRCHLLDCGPRLPNGNRNCAIMEIREVPTLHVAKQMFSAYCPTMYRLMPARMWKQIRTQSKFAFDDRTLPKE